MGKVKKTPVKVIVDFSPYHYWFVHVILAVDI